MADTITRAAAHAAPARTRESTMSTDLLDPCRNGNRRRGLERTRFFQRQLVTPEDLTQDQVYFREKHRRHNRMLHGWGVVCGACVRLASECEVIVEAGYILGPWGDEIVIPDEVTVNVCRARAHEQIGCCDPAPLDPWCDDGRAECTAGTMYLAVRYAECEARPVRALQSGCGCGCDESACEYSRIRDGYAFAVLSELPPTYTTPMRQPSMLDILPGCAGRQRTARPCPPCPESPWVVLADLAVDRECKVRQVDCFAHRRHVVSFANFYFICPPVSTFSFLTQPDRVSIARSMAGLTGTLDLVDLDAPAGAAPRATVAMVRAEGGTVSLPAFFEVRSGETARELLEREGERTFYDPATDQTITLRALFASAGVPAETTFAGTAAALAPLEGRTLALGEERDRRAILEETLERAGLERLEREHGGAAARAVELPATVLVGVAPRSTLGRFITEMSVGDVAAMDREEFVEAAAETASERQKDAVRKQATEVWEHASRVRRLG